jgi:hypothetical protein
MGLENTGFAIANEDNLWIDPVDYRDDLAAGVALLSAGGVHVSVYNLPLCVLHRKICPLRFSPFRIGRMHICRCVTDALSVSGVRDSFQRGGCVKAEDCGLSMQRSYWSLAYSMVTVASNKD